MVPSPSRAIDSKWMPLSSVTWEVIASKFVGHAGGGESCRINHLNRIK